MMKFQSGLSKLLVVVCAVLLSMSSNTMFASPNNCDDGQCNWTEMVNQKGEKEHLKLEKVPSDGIEAYMPIAKTKDTGIPETMQGIWWMNFGQSGDILVTFATAHWDKNTRTAIVPVYGAKTFSFHATDIGAASYYPLLATHYRYILKFSDQDRFATITPELEILGRKFAVPEYLVKFNMRYQGEGIWVRQSWFFGQRTPDYPLTRVVDENGVRDEAYHDYLKVAGKESYIPVTSP